MSSNPSSASSAINVMVVDDTITYRTILSRIMGAFPNTQVSSASNGKLALSKMQDNPCELVLLDIEMPEMDGLETLKHIRRDYPKTKVVMVSGMNRHSADITLKALEAGAFDFIPKPDCASPQESEEQLRSKLLPIVNSLLRIINSSRPRPEAAAPVKPSIPASSAPSRPATPLPGATATPVIPRPSSLAKPSKIDVIAIGISTGGPNSLIEVIPKLPGDLGVPILIVQHMPPVFTESLAQNLDKRSALHVKEAKADEPVLPNTVYIAPGGRHMEVVRKGISMVISLHDNAPENSCRPAADVLFRSVAKAYGHNILGLVMTGMGSDGALGMQVMKAAGCHCITQSASSCVVYGMPRAVDEMGLSDEQLDLQVIPQRIIQLVQRR